jgi:hypothetical protein
LRLLAVIALAVAGALAVPVLPAGAAETTAQAASCTTSRPHSGTFLFSGIRGGLGKLTIKNDIGSQDGVVVLVRGRSKAVSVYVRARASTTISNVKDGSYTIYFTTGSAFSTCQERFTRGAAYYRVNGHLSFASPPHYTTATLTLYAVSGGNASTSPIGSSGFPVP